MSFKFDWRWIVSNLFVFMSSKTSLMSDLFRCDLIIYKSEIALFCDSSVSDLSIFEKFDLFELGFVSESSKSDCLC